MIKALEPDGVNRFTQKRRPTVEFIEPDGVNRFTQKQLMLKWGVSDRTVRTRIRCHKGCPIQLIGIQSVFELSEVLRIERAERELRERTLERLRGGRDDRDGGAGIVSMAELRRVKARAQRKAKR